MHKLNSVEEEEEQQQLRQKQGIDGLLTQQIALIKDPDKSLRLKAIALTSAHLKYASSHVLQQNIRNMLEQQLWAEKDPLLLQHMIKLLGDIAVYHTLPQEITLSIVDTLHKYLEAHRAHDDLIITQIVSSLICIADQTSVFRELDGALALFLLCTNKINLRTRLLNLLAVTTKSRNTEYKGEIQKITMFGDTEGGNRALHICERFTKDPYPSVRKAALEGLISLHRKGYNLTKDCYRHAVALLQDKDELVRLCAIQVVSDWVEMLHRAEEIETMNQINEAFLQLCTMSRDMNVKVRREAHYALGRMGIVSESLLLQSLSKKFLGFAAKKLPHTSIIQTPEGDIDLADFGEGLEPLILSAAGALLHGVEDEFAEVRIAAVDSLAWLSGFSKQFAEGALDLLMDMLNDDSTEVRMHTLSGLFHMAQIDRLMVQEKHMHMFLGMLEDINADIRSAARRLLSQMKLPGISVFKMSIEALMNNLDKHPQDEQDIINVMYHIGKTHGTYIVCSAKEFIQQITAYSNVDLGLDHPRLAILLMLILAAQMSNAGILFHIPQQVISYVNHFWGKFSAAVTGSTANAKIHFSLSEYHQKCSENINIERSLASRSEGTNISVQEERDTVHLKQQQIFDNTTNKSRLQLSLQSQDIFPKSVLEHYKTSAHDTGMPKQRQCKELCPHEKDILCSATNILKVAVGIWPLLREKALPEALKTLSGCRADLEMMKRKFEGSSSVIAFASLYTRSIYLLTKLWASLTPGCCQYTYPCGIDSSQRLLEQLDKVLIRMRYCFLGLCEEQQLRILELNALSCILRLSLYGVNVQYLTYRKLSSVISLAEQLFKGDGVKHSAFLEAITKHLSVEDPKMLLKLVQELPKLLLFEFIPLVEELKEIRAVLVVPNNNDEHPLRFVTGMPLGITMSITFHNISSGSRIWLLMVLGDSVQYSILDINEFEGLGGVKCGIITVPLYVTLKVASCFLEVSVMMECPFNYRRVLKRCRAGPRGALVSLSNVEKVHVTASVDKNCNM